MLGEQHPAKLCEGDRPDIVERPQDALAVIDGECDDSSSSASDFSRNERVGSSTSVMSSRTSSSGTCKPARYTEAKVPGAIVSKPPPRSSDAGEGAQVRRLLSNEGRRNVDERG